MRLLSKRQLKELVLYSPQHVARLEAAGRFPKRVQLGQCRVGWIEQEVLDWLQEGAVSSEPVSGSDFPVNQG
jgi:prophage regulatory protein